MKKKTADVGEMREPSVFPRGTMGRRSVRVLEGGPQLPFNPSRIPLSEPGFASCGALGRVKKESVSVGQISTFLPCHRPKEEACKASKLSWKYSLPHGRGGGSLAGPAVRGQHILAVDVRNPARVCVCVFFLSCDKDVLKKTRFI